MRRHGRTLLPHRGHATSLRPACYVANEGKLIAVVPRGDAERVLDKLRSHPLGRNAAVIGEVVEEHPGMVIQRSLVPGVRDTQCGFKAFTAEAARELFRYARIDGWAFDLEILALFSYTL